MDWSGIITTFMSCIIGPALLVIINHRNQKKDRLGAIEKRLDKMEQDRNEENAKLVRMAIIEGADDLSANPSKPHTSEWWQLKLRQCDDYEKFIHEPKNAGFKNYVAESSIRTIRQSWESLDNHIIDGSASV